MLKLISIEVTLVHMGGNHRVHPEESQLSTELANIIPLLSECKFNFSAPQ